MLTRRQLIVALAAAGAAPAWMRAAGAAGNRPIAPGMHKVRGPVFLNERPAREGMPIEPGDIVVTGPAAEAIYVIGQDAFLQRADTRVEFPMQAAGFFRLVTGKLLSVFGPGEKKLRVPTATIGIRGTGCYLEGTDAQTYFCLCYGEAEVIPAAVPEARVVLRTRHHDHPIVIAREPGTPSGIAGAPVLNHSDAELKLLESLMGRWPPFGSIWDSRY